MVRPKYRGTATWSEESQHGRQRITLEVASETPSQAQANAEARARLWRLMGRNDPDNPLFEANR